MSGNAESIHQLWLAQTREEAAMPLDDIRAKAQRLDSKNRRTKIVTWTVVLLAIAGDAWSVWYHTELLLRAGNLLTIAAFVYIAHRYRKHMRAVPPAVLGQTNSYEFYRSELARQRDLSQDSWGFYLPFVPGLSLIMLGRLLEPRPTRHAIAIVTFFVALFVGVFWLSARTTRKLQREIDALDA